MIHRRLLALVLAFPGAALAQIPGLPTPPPPPPIGIVTSPFDTMMGNQPRRRDTTKTDSLKPPKELVKWAETDSVMQSLIELPGYTVTRYQGNQVVLQAPRKDITIDGKGAIERGKTLLVADTIFYSDSAKMMRATAPEGDTIVLRDPSQGTSDINAQGFLLYNITQHRGLVGKFATSTRQTGQTWYVTGHEAAFVGDTTPSARNTEYAEDGSITSCDLAIPHYHFQSTEIKVVSKSIMVARPAVLYIADVPVLWMPFIFQDMRPGRHSGMLTPRFGIADIVRTTPTYVRQIENVGYYFAINDYTDAQFAVGWRSGVDQPPTALTGGTLGWTILDGRWRFRWLDQFLSSDLSASYQWATDHSTNLSLSWHIIQQFSQNSNLNASLNYLSNTNLYRQNAYTVATALASIGSQLNYTDKLGPFTLNAGGGRTQYSGSPEVQLNAPTFSLSSQPIEVAKGVLWTPGFSVTNQTTSNQLTAGYQYQSFPGDSLDSTQVFKTYRTSSAALQTPFRFGDFQLPLNVTLRDAEVDVPQTVLFSDFNTGQPVGQRTYAKTYRTEADWQTGVALPSLSPGKWNITPFVGFSNADGSAGYWVRTQLTGGEWVSQTKVIQGGVGIQPTFYGFFGGFGPFSRIRHSFTPRIGITYSPSTNVPDAYLHALNYTRFGYLGGLEQASASLNLLNTIEAKLRPKGDTLAASQGPNTGADKIKLLTLNLSPLTYDFKLAQKIGRGITTPTFHWDVASDLLPGLAISADYSLFSGNPISDTAKFDPFRTSISIQFNIGKGNNPFSTYSRIFGGVQPADSAAGGTNQMIANGGASLPPLGQPSAGAPTSLSTGGGWNLSISFTSSRSRPVTGSNVSTFDPKTYCATFISDPITYNQCLQRVQAPSDTTPTTTAGTPVIVLPTTATLRTSTSFDLTPHWAVQWTSGYDFVQHKFSDNAISLQRSMHDWRAIFSFLQSPNGNFAFSFTVSLIAEPDLKFDYNRRNDRPTSP